MDQNIKCPPLTIHKARRLVKTIFLGNLCLQYVQIGPGSLQLDSSRADAEFAVVFVSVASLALSIARQFMF